MSRACVKYDHRAVSDATIHTVHVHVCSEKIDDPIMFTRNVRQSWASLDIRVFSHLVSPQVTKHMEQ